MTVIDQATLPQPLGFVTREDARNIEAGVAECMLMMREKTGKFERPVYSRPGQVVAVPPAGGEVEIAGYAGRNAVKGFMNNGSEVSVMLKPERFFDIPLTPLENMTRLQAELSGFKCERSFFVKRNDELHKQNADLQSELTKAIGWLKHAKPFLHSGGFHLAADDIGNFLANQSAPAAKGDSDE